MQAESSYTQTAQSLFQKVWGRHVDLLCCPDCRGQSAGLYYKQDSGREALICGNCNFEFPIINDIPILLPKGRIGIVDEIRKIAVRDVRSSGVGASGASDSMADWKYLSFQYYSRFCEFKKSMVDLRPQDIVLDIGCAGGSIADDFENYIGLDTSWKLISFARHHSDKPFVLADAQAIPFKADSIDCAVSRNLLEHTINDREIIREIRRVCRSNGIFELPCSDGVSFLIDPINTIRIRAGLSPKPFFSYGFGHINMQTEKEWEKRLTENGFKVIGKKYLGRGIIFKLITFLECALFSYGDNDDIPARLVERKSLRFIHMIYDFVYKLDPKTKKSWSRVFIVTPKKQDVA